ncbi:variant surface glycoprotein [Trypanosoma brucei equiperdum]|uniref:Variant surface glycoprotein n=1 Tax=Trypanosoma brucei equiperdum TaxID=630700 RepID=A0A3L6L1V9_9TRYP|nr:variant surface glycoprotein [Trypanosoma brucei equiperdum]
MAPHRGLVISALAILLTPSQFGDCNKHAIKVKGIAKLCKLSTEFRRVVPFVKHTASEWQTKLKDAKPLLSDIQVMRRQGTEQSAKIPAAFVLFMADTIEAAQNAQEELIKIAAEAAATSGLAAGAIDQTISIFRQTTLGSETDYCIEQDGNANKLTDFQSLNFCTSADNSIAPLVTTAAAAVPNEKISDTEFTDANIGDAKGASNKCAITQHGASGGYHAATHGTADIKWAAGMLKFGNAALGRNAFADISQNKNGVPLVKAAAEAIDALKRHADEGLSALTNILKIQETSKATFQTIKTQTKQPGTSSAAVDIEMNSDRLNDIRSIVAEYRKTTKPEKKQADARDELQNNYLTSGGPNADTGSTEGCPEIKSTADQACNKIKDETKCNNKPFCSYNETETDTTKKCKFNETKASKIGFSLPQSQTGGSGTSAASDRCTKHKDKANCEKET